MYEEPIVASRQPTASAEEKVMGEARASQVEAAIVCVRAHVSMCTYILTMCSGESSLPEYR